MSRAYLMVDIRSSFYNRDGETLEQIAQRDGICPVSGDIWGQAGQGSEQYDRPVGVPALCREQD